MCSFSSVRNLRAPLAITTLAIFLLTAAIPALADSYSITVVANTQSETFFGIDATGNFVVNLTADLVNPCGGGGASCFATYFVGQAPVFSTAPPLLAYDDGSTCAPTLFPGFTPQGGNHGSCNNGHAIVGGSDAQNPVGVWVGSDPVADLLLIGSFDGGFINSSGDAVFIDGFNNTLISAVDLTSDVPEPGSLILFGTGCLAMLGTLRRFTRG